MFEIEFQCSWIGSFSYWGGTNNDFDFRAPYFEPIRWSLYNPEIEEQNREIEKMLRNRKWIISIKPHMGFFVCGMMGRFGNGFELNTIITKFQ